MPRTGDKREHILKTLQILFQTTVTNKYCNKASATDFLVSQWLSIKCAIASCLKRMYQSVQLSSVAQSCPTLCNPMNRSMPGLRVHHQLPESTQTHVHWVSDAIQPSHPLLSPSPAFSLSQHQGLFKWVSSSHQLAKVLELQLQHQSFQWTPGTDL